MPRCRDCGSEHGPGPCILSQQDKNAQGTPSPEARPADGEGISHSQRTKEWRSKNHEKYNEYQREYMREYRAGKRRRG